MTDRSAQTIIVPLSTDWLFTGPIEMDLPDGYPLDDLSAEEARPDLDDSGYERVTLPHAVAPLSWQQWDPTTWEKVWSYRKHFDLPEGMAGRRVFIDVEAAMTNATVTLNGVLLGAHKGGYLPFSFEITEAAKPHGNVLAVLLDSRFNLNVPPNIPIPVPSTAVDFWQPGGIHGQAALRAVPRTFVRDVVATPHDVLDDARRGLRIDCSLDAPDGIASGLDLRVQLVDAQGRVVASTTAPVSSDQTTLSIGALPQVDLWDIDSPALYTVVSTLVRDGEEEHSHTVRIGFREARFESDGFYLNGTRRYLFGTNRHGHFPYVGFAMPDRVQRKDAEILKNELNCVMVRCAHYPQTPAFLDACDELGLLVWEESPGWQYVGDAEWQAQASDDIAAMVVRDRNRPSVIIWGARLNETPDHPEFYAATDALVKKLDPTRATSGAMFRPYRMTETYQHDVFSYCDYSIDILDNGDRRPTLKPPREGWPYLICEAVTSWSSPTRLYLRADSPLVQQHQALDLAHVHDDAQADARYTGLLNWSGFDYQSGYIINHRGLKTSGLGDTFRVLKPGAAIYRAQVDPAVRVVLEPAFTWDPPVEGQIAPYGDNRTPGDSWGPGEKAMICSNCDRLEVYLNGELHASVEPDREQFPHLAYAPSFVDLRSSGRAGAELRLDGFINEEHVISRTFAGDRLSDSVSVKADDDEIVADGVDATRVVLAIADRYGQYRGNTQARLIIEVEGPGTLVGETPFDLEPSGGVGAVWIRSVADAPGPITVRATHPRLGTSTVTIRSQTAG